MAYAKELDFFTDPGFTLPLSAVTQRFGFFGKTGSGKTYGGTKLAELLLLAGAQVVALDPAGKWRGLRRDGLGKGFEIPIFGGKDGDLPLDSGSGAFVARLIVERRISAVIDMSQFRKGAFRRFVTDFVEELFYLQKSLDDPEPMHVFLEEAHLVAPQNSDAKDVPRMLGAVVDLAREGRNHGIGLSVLDQRPATVNKDVTTQVECLLVFQTTSAQDRKAVREWIDEHEAEGGEQLSRVKSLDEGECFVYSPSWLKIFRKTKVKAKRSADISKTPQLGAKRTPLRPLTPVDVEEIRAAWSSVIAEVEAKDPAALRKRISDLERELAAVRAVKPGDKVVEKTTVRELDLKRLEVALDKVAHLSGANAESLLDTVFRKLEALHKKDSDARTAANHAMLDVRDEIRSLRLLGRVASPVSESQRQVSTKPAEGVAVTMPSSRAAELRKRPANGSGISGSQQRVLDSLAWYAVAKISQPTRLAVALRGGVRLSGFFDRTVGEMKTAGLVEYPASGRLSLTEKGRALATFPDDEPTNKDLQDVVMAMVSGTQQRILAAMLPRRLDSAKRQQVADEIRLRMSGFLDRTIGELKTLGVLHYPTKGDLALTPVVFPLGAP